jgi:hypothetical protein
MAKILRYDDVAANPFETAVVAAWEALFAPGPDSLPAVIKQSYATVALPNITGHRMKKINLCTQPHNNNMPKGDAKVDNTHMKLTGLTSMKPSGSVSFASNDRVARFPTALSNIEVTGDFLIKQECCVATLFGCTGNYGAKQPGKFSFKADSATLTVDATVGADDKTGKPIFTVAGVHLDVAGKPKVNVDVGDKLPSWLKSLVDALDGWYTATDGLQGEITTEVPASLRENGFISKVQTMLNAVS